MQLSWKIIQYWIYWINEESSDPIIEALFIQIKVMIDKRKEISIANSENWKKWWRPKKTETKAKQKPKKSETKANENNIEHWTINIEQETNNIILSDDTETKVSEYWNSEINQCLNLIKQYNGWLLDWTVKQSRQYAKLLIDKLNKLESIQSWKYSRSQTLEIILQVVSKNKYHSSKITSVESIYRNLAVLMQVCKNDISKTQTSSIILPTV